jgi:hypothetical protein
MCNTDQHSVDEDGGISAAFTFLRSHSLDDFGIDVHVDSLHVWCSSPHLVLGEILSKW